MTGGLRLYNTLTRRVEPFVPLHPPRVTVYMCGPTVWNYAHVGNFRTFIIGDVLRRYLEYSGYQVLFVMNLTDVDDRIIKAAREAGQKITEFTEPFAREFERDRRFLGIDPDDKVRYPNATDHIGEMQTLVARLLDRKLAYVGDDGSVYFAVRSFPTYGRLSRLETRELKAGARVSSDEYAKEDAQDFALWKAATPDDEAAGAAWDAPFGRGRPGWHLECSAMALTELQKEVDGLETLDIHAGGKDLVFPHHENEVAQSEGATGSVFARVWLHAAFLTVSGSKMSKRFGNILTVKDLREQNVDPRAFRQLVLSTRYSKDLNFTDEALQGAAEGVRKLGEARRRLRELKELGGPAHPPPSDAAPEAAAELGRSFRAALDDDLNTPQGLEALFTFSREANRAMDSQAWSPGQAAAALTEFESAREVIFGTPKRVVDVVLRLSPTEVDKKVTEREAARRARDFARADAIRKELADIGIELKDTPSGPRVEHPGASEDNDG